MTSRNDGLSLLLSLTILTASAPVMASEVRRHELSSEEVATAQAAVQQQLRDPDSAQFRNLVAADVGAGKVVLCGEINAKNGAGGLTGFQRFYGNLGGKIIIAEGSLATSMSKMFCDPIDAVQ